MKKAIGIVVSIVMCVLMTGSFMSVMASEPGKAPVTMAEAVKTALEDAGASEGQIEFCKKIYEFSDGNYVYDIQFLTRGSKTYEYEIDALTGKILERDQDAWEAEDDRNYQGLKDAGQDLFLMEDEKLVEELILAYDAALADSGEKAADAFLYKIGVEYEDGRVVYAVNILVPDKMKYEFDINPADKKIAVRDADYWEGDDSFEYGKLIGANKKMEPTDVAVLEEK